MPTSLSKYLDPTGLDETVVNIRQLTEALEAEMQELPYARPDGLYPDMTVGAVIGADSTAQWAQRESTGSGSATVRSVQGAAVVWNQLVINGGFDGSTYWGGRESNISVADGVATITPTSDGTARGLQQLHDARIQNAVTGHKYLTVVDFKCNVATNLSISFSGNSPVTFTVPNVGAWNHCGVIWWVSSDVPSLRFYALASATLTTTDQMQFKNAKAFDLTQMFGSGNEPTTVAEFERMYPESYYPYSAPTLKPVQIAGIRSTDAQGGELDAIEWTAQTLRAAGSVADVLYGDHVDVRVGAVDLGALTWNYDANNAYFYATLAGVLVIGSAGVLPNFTCAQYTTITSRIGSGWGSAPDKSIGTRHTTSYVCVKDIAYTTIADFKTAMNGVLLFYELATPTTQPLSPALPMSYKVEQSGSEAIIVPDGEISAAPVLTIAEPVNMSTELARIWEAIQSLGYTRNAAQLSRPVSLTDIGSIDEVQKDTTDIAEIDTTKEVQE